MSLEMTGSDILVRSLADEGVEHVFGYPGGSVLYIYDAIYKPVSYTHLDVYKRQAAYLCELNGYNLNGETHVTMDPEFLMQQIEWRESLENAREDKDIARLEKLDEEQRNLRKEQMDIVEKHLDDKQFDKAVQDIRKMMFLEKFNEEISLAFDELDSTN